MTSSISTLTLIIECLAREDEPLTPREIARHLLNDRAVSGLTLDALTDRVDVDLKMERRARGETSRFIYVEGRYALAERLSDVSDELSLTYAEGTRDRAVMTPIDDHAPQPTRATLSDLTSSPTEERSQEVTLRLRDYPLAHQVAALLNLTHGERASLVDALRRSLRRALRSEQTRSSLNARELERASSLEVVNSSATSPRVPSPRVPSPRDNSPDISDQLAQLKAHNADHMMSVEQWIQTHLSAGSALLARRLWRDSGQLIEPLIFESCWALIERYQLMSASEDGVWRINDRGLSLTSAEGWSESDIAREIDDAEGVYALLMSCLELGQPDTMSLCEAWGREMRRLGRRRARAWLLDASRSRLRHLSARGLITKELERWRLSEEGLSWLRRGGVEAPSADREALERVWEAMREQRTLARESIADLLSRMEPRHFEELICELLERMGYEEVSLTAHTHDLGVDVVASIELGITSAREVVQVKRQHRSIHRPVLDALRGSLHRFEAVRGTLITTSSFSRGTREAAFERGAAPITLIDGERLIDLLMRYELGVKPVEVKLWQVDPQAFEVSSGRAWPRWPRA